MLGFSISLYKSSFLSNIFCNIDRILCFYGSDFVMFIVFIVLAKSRCRQNIAFVANRAKLLKCMDASKCLAFSYYLIHFKKIGVLASFMMGLFYDFFYKKGKQVIESYNYFRDLLDIMIKSVAIKCVFNSLNMLKSSIFNSRTYNKVVNLLCRSDAKVRENENIFKHFNTITCIKV